ncbi:response regulator transcription factor [Embleya scabrispora]|uniref:response regulator transcription factor n=1 Tax=Embleya scabrispora TaxID=159449 RepID=UPI000361CC9A|nr:response regulator transcription factor [Embleya scabrispora]
MNTEPRPIRVLLADDEALIRAGVGAVLANDPGVEVVAEAADGHQLIEQARLYRPDVALVDIRMPNLDGLAATVELRRVVPETAVVILTTFGEDGYIARAIDSGAAGFLLKSGDPRELGIGLRAAADGGAYLSPKVAKHVITHLARVRPMRDAGAAARLAGLTARERDVLALLGAGLSNMEIGRRLHLVEGTIKAHVSAILTRLDVRNRVQAAILAHEAGLVADPSESRGDVDAPGRTGASGRAARSTG